MTSYNELPNGSKTRQKNLPGFSVVLPATFLKGQKATKKHEILANLTKDSHERIKQDGTCQFHMIPVYFWEFPELIQQYHAKWSDSTLKDKDEHHPSSYFYETAY